SELATRAFAAATPVAPATPERTPRIEATTTDVNGIEDRYVPTPRHLSPERHDGPDRGSRMLIMGVAAAAILVVSGGMFAARRYFVPAPKVATEGTLVVTTDPAAAQAFVDGELRGETPLKVTLK